MDIYDDRLVFSRLDVRDGSSYGPPWIVPLPFAANSAPFRPEVAAARTRRAKFTPDASVKARLVQDGCVVEFPDSTVDAPAFMYRIEVMRKNDKGDWTPFTRDDIFSEFWKAPKLRTGRMEYKLDIGFFVDGGVYRIRVTPLDWFYRGTRPIECNLSVPAYSGKVVWRSVCPAKEMRFTEYGKPVPLSIGGRYAPSSGQGTLHLPPNVLSGLEPSKQARCILEIETVQPEGEWCAWRTAMRPRGGALMSSVQTAPGSPGPLRYVFKFTVPEKGMDSADFLFNYASPGGSLRVLSASVLQ